MGRGRSPRRQGRRPHPRRGTRLHSHGAHRQPRQRERVNASGRSDKVQRLSPPTKAAAAARTPLRPRPATGTTPRILDTNMRPCAPGAAQPVGRPAAFTAQDAPAQLLCQQSRLAAWPSSSSSSSLREVYARRFARKGALQSTEQDGGDRDQKQERRELGGGKHDGVWCRADHSPLPSGDKVYRTFLYF